MLKDKNQLTFEEKWPKMRPTILKLLRLVHLEYLQINLISVIYVWQRCEFTALNTKVELY